MAYDKTTLISIIDYCEAKWVEVRGQINAAEVQDIDTLTGRKMAYNDVLQHARKLLDEAA